MCLTKGRAAIHTSSRLHFPFRLGMVQLIFGGRIQFTPIHDAFGGFPIRLRITFVIQKSTELFDAGVSTITALDTVKESIEWEKVRFRTMCESCSIDKRCTRCDDDIKTISFTSECAYWQPVISIFLPSTPTIDSCNCKDILNSGWISTDGQAFRVQVLRIKTYRGSLS